MLHLVDGGLHIPVDKCSDRVDEHLFFFIEVE
jgi:hypothetical protein